MNGSWAEVARGNLLLAWVWIVLGFVSGSYLGLHFHDENWLGGYASHRRRLYRLGHISFFGLALVNWMFYFTAIRFPASGALLRIAGMSFIAGAICMPAACGIIAHRPSWRAIFVFPVAALFSGVFFTLWSITGL